MDNNLWITLTFLLSMVVHQAVSMRMPSTGYVYLVHKVDLPGVLKSVEANCKHKGKIWLQLWRPREQSKLEYMYGEEIQITSNHVKTDSFVNLYDYTTKTNACIRVKKNDRIGILATGPDDMFPFYSQMNSSYDIPKKKMTEVPEINKKYEFDRKTQVDIKIRITTRTTIGSVLTSGDNVLVNCPLVIQTSTTTTTTATASPTTASTTEAESLPQTEEDSTVTPQPVQTTLPVAMYAGVGSIGGVLLIVVIVIVVVICRKRHKQSTSQRSYNKSSDSNAYTTSIPQINEPINKQSLTKNPMYGVTMNSNYDYLSAEARRPTSTHDYSPIIPKRPDLNGKSNEMPDSEQKNVNQYDDVMINRDSGITEGSEGSSSAAMQRQTSHSYEQLH